MHLFALLAALGAAPDAKIEGPFAATCSYFNTENTSAAVDDVPCQHSWVEDTTKEVIEGKGFRVVVDYSDSQAQGNWRRATMNGKPAVIYQFYRDSHTFTTLDLTEFVEIRGRGQPKYPLYDCDVHK